MFYFQSISFLLKIFFFARDWLRYTLQRWHGHPYTIMGIDNTPFACAWGRNAFGKLSADEAETIGLKEIKTGLQKSLETVGAYANDTDARALEAANLFLLLHDLEKASRTMTPRSYGFWIKYPAMIFVC